MSNHSPNPTTRSARGSARSSGAIRRPHTCAAPSERRPSRRAFGQHGSRPAWRPPPWRWCSGSSGSSSCRGSCPPIRPSGSCGPSWPSTPGRSCGGPASGGGPDGASMAHPGIGHRLDQVFRRRRSAHVRRGGTGVPRGAPRYGALLPRRGRSSRDLYRAARARLTDPRVAAGSDPEPVAAGPHERRRILRLGMAPGRPRLLHRVRHGLESDVEHFKDYFALLRVSTEPWFRRTILHRPARAVA